MNLSKLHYAAARLVDALSTELIYRDDEFINFRAVVHLRSPIDNTLVMVQSGWWPSKKGAQRELLRMLRGVRLSKEGNA